MKLLSVIDDAKDIVSKKYVDDKITTLESSITSLQNNKADSADLDMTNGAVGILQSDFQDLSQGVIAMSNDVSQNKTDISGIKTDIAISTATIDKFKALGFKG